MFRAYSYQATRARTKPFSGLERHRRWLWFEQKTFDFHGILKKLGLIEQPSLTNSQINVQYPELQEAIYCFCDRKQAQRKGELCKQR